ncbi:hypothetical protein [Helicobacter cappadocius]|uniref:Uncharacterized protein n=1 Tax=Helicobacter cappadocius TaxID=3063998 RepID=A0AA90PL51_9HELI|nr:MULTISPECIES: hypothetical protein [unclassified Helicobacter]MDO7253200.1 hypothetical protein [Helicobacter sp. faydin-H75]MDP2539124.1 hypothetical protein [Helicobacter sp. faydin-H76]
MLKKIVIILSIVLLLSATENTEDFVGMLNSGKSADETIGNGSIARDKSGFL